MKLSEQMRTNALALISLFVAFTALGYNTWRNELTEYNRTTREAGFEMLVHIGELQRITYLAQYDRDLVDGNPRKGWVEVLVLRDLARLMPVSARQRSDELHDTWSQQWNDQGADDEQAVASIDNAINALRIEVVASLEALE